MSNITFLPSIELDREKSEAIVKLEIERQERLQALRERQKLQAHQSLKKAVSGLFAPIQVKPNKKKKAHNYR